MKKPTVLFVMHEMTTGGAERVTLNIVNHINKDDFNVHLCLFKKKGKLLDQLSEDVVVHDLKAKRVLSGVPGLIKLILGLKPSIVFSNIMHVTSLIAFLSVFLKLFLKNTAFIARETSLPSIRVKYNKNLRYLDFFYKLFVNNYDFIVAQSIFMKEDIVSRYKINKHKIIVINNAVNIHHINKLSNIQSDEILFNKSKINILAVGNLRYAKGFDMLLNTMTYLDEAYHLSIIGYGKEKEYLENLAKELNITEKVTFVGYKENPYVFMKQSNIVVLSSRYEGFPNVIIEANACGKFVVAFSCPGVNNEIIENDNNGYLVEFGNYKLFAEAIKKYSIIKHDHLKIASSVNKYMATEIVKKYENLFKTFIFRGDI